MMLRDKVSRYFAFRMVSSWTNVRVLKYEDENFERKKRTSWLGCVCVVSSNRQRSRSFHHNRNNPPLFFGARTAGEGKFRSFQPKSNCLFVLARVLAHNKFTVHRKAGIFDVRRNWDLANTCFAVGRDEMECTVDWLIVWVMEN